MAKEATSWDWLRNGITKTLPHFSLLERVENGVHFGTADVNYILRGVEGWIETKAVALPKREGTAVLGEKEGVNINQKNWHRKRQHALGKTWIFISAPPYRWLVHGMYADEVNDWTRDDLCGRATMWYDENWTPSLWKRLVNILSDYRVGERP